jgi:hypothetical protein
METKKLIVMRGLPWTGKSYTAKERAGDTGVIYSTDEYWYKIRHPDKPDEYSFNPRYLADAHKWNQLRTQKSVEEGHPLIIIDNTNTVAAECHPYVFYAHCQDYEIEIAEPTSDRWKEISALLADRKEKKKELREWAGKLSDGSKEGHNVPQWSIERMMWRWQNGLTVEGILAAGTI